MFSLKGRLHLSIFLYAPRRNINPPFKKNPAQSTKPQVQKKFDFCWLFFFLEKHNLSFMFQHVHVDNLLEKSFVSCQTLIKFRMTFPSYDIRKLFCLLISFPFCLPVFDWDFQACICSSGFYQSDCDSAGALWG